MRPAKKSIAVVAASLGVLLASAGAPALGSPHARSADETTTPQLTIKMSGHTGFDVTGSRSFPAGLVDATLIAGKGEQEFEVIGLHDGYTYAMLVKDFKAFSKTGFEGPPSHASLVAFRHLIHNTTFYGGGDSGTGNKTISVTLALPTEGTYYLVADDTGPDGKIPPVKLSVSASTGSPTSIPTAGAQIATTAKRFSGPVDLPASGTITFHNASTESPHFLALLHVKKGTTRRQVIKGLQQQGKPSFALPGSVGSDVLSYNQTQTLTYTLAAGDYAELCFFPDPKTGMPHAFMGMVRIVHLS